MSSPLEFMYASMLEAMSGKNHFSRFIDNGQRKRVLKGLVENFYAESTARVIFDTNRFWTARASGLARLFPEAKIICCVRSVPWVLDSFERLYQANPLEISKLFNFDASWTVYDRIDSLMRLQGTVGRALNSLSEAYFGTESKRLTIVPYDALTREPETVIRNVYASIGEKYFAHDFNNLSYDEKEFDESLGLQQMHSVRPKIEPNERKTILPPLVFKRYESMDFWSR